MKPKTELFLYQMLWGASRLAQPSFRKLDEGFEAWAYRKGFLRQVYRLEEAGYLESRQTSFDDSRIHRLTQAGRVAALGGRDPEVAWSAPWDSKWRLFLFDVPETKRTLRRKLTRSLAASGCGCLQGSVWIHASRPAGMEKSFPEDGADCSHLMILEAESRGPKVDRQMVTAAWDFKQINSLYRRHLEVMEKFPKGPKQQGASALAGWAQRENTAWLDAVHSDPLLPASLLPKGYLGRRAWRQRQKIMARAARLAQRAAGPGTETDGTKTPRRKK